ncbi:MAG: transcriptional repressor [Deltaproteobacteria bacterium]|nr:transcriptional repressor [Deltaproteobacteria bacterium]MBW1818060.1 transcriptional repressor [Deltaproteobacteria bacterium]
MTHQRQVILDAVKSSKGHPTADEIYEKVRKILPRVSMGTVYRNLDILSTTGFIKKLEPGHPQMHFECETSDHYHLICERCGAIEDIPAESSDNPMEKLESALGNLTKYGIFGHKLEFFGLCRKCLREGAELPHELPRKQTVKEEEK